MDTMPQHYNLLLVTLSYVISVLGSFTALRLCRQHAGARGAEKWRSLLAGALAMGAGAIWSMHFIGMLAFDMGMPVANDVPITLASLLVAVVVTGLGIYVVGKGPTSLWRLVVGGTAMGLGVAAMHYTGMAAMRMQARLSYDLVIVAISLGIAVVASIAALWLVFNTTRLWQIVASALVMGLAVCGALHRHEGGDHAARPGAAGPGGGALARDPGLRDLPGDPGDPVAGVAVGQQPAGDRDPAHGLRPVDAGDGFDRPPPLARIHPVRRFAERRARPP